MRNLCLTKPADEAVPDGSPTAVPDETLLDEAAPDEAAPDGSLDDDPPSSSTERDVEAG